MGMISLRTCDPEFWEKKIGNFAETKFLLPFNYELSKIFSGHRLPRDPLQGTKKKKSNFWPLGRKLNFYPETFREFSKLWGDLVRKPLKVESLIFIYCCYI